MKMLQRVLVPIALLAMSVTAAQAQFYIPPYPYPVPTAAPETILAVGSADITAEGGFATQSISTAQIDSVLRTVAPSVFGQNFTRDKANKAFADFNNFKTGLGTSIKQAIESSDASLRVNSVTINSNAINMRLAQKTNSVAGQLGAFTVMVSGKKHVGVPLICPSADFSFSVNNAMVSGDYNYITGDVSNVTTSYTISNVNTSCNGFGLWNLLVNFVNNITGIGNNAVRNAIQDAANSAVTFANMKQLFSLADFANGLNYFRNETPVTAVANQAISVFKEIVNDAAINTPGIALDFRVEFATGTMPQNKISILASSAPLYDVLSAAIFRFNPSTYQFEQTITISAPVDGQTVDIYCGGYYPFTWTYLGTTATNTLIVSTPYGCTFGAVGRNSRIPGLRSLPGGLLYPAVF